MMSTLDTGDTVEGEESSEPSSLSKDDTFHILQNERRRRVLAYLADTDGPVDMRDIAEQVAAWEHDTTVQQLSSDQRQRVYIALYQSHLPKLADFGLIHYNRSRGIVERTPLADEVTAYLLSDTSADSEDETPARAEWLRYYAAVTALSGVGVIVVWAGIFAAIPGVGLAAAITVAYGVLTLALALDAL
jgi:DNA-binding transcriptional ArsR family regulator